MITQKDDRMLELLWHVALCGDFPTQLAKRLDGHHEWNRHVMYRAVKQGFVRVYRCRFRQRMIRSLRITGSGLRYIAEMDPDSAVQVLSVQEMNAMRQSNVEKIIRSHAVATGLVMAEKAGAVILPKDKPSLLFGSGGSGAGTFRSDIPIYYSVQEIRDAISEYDQRTVAKTSRVLGVIISGTNCFYLYYTGFSRMYWRAGEELNTIAAIDSILHARGFTHTSNHQIVIGTNMDVAVKIAKQGIDRQSRYFTLSSHVNSCRFITNDENGDALLRLTVNEPLQTEFNRAILVPGFRPPAIPTRFYDAVTADGKQPVILSYLCDLMSLLNLEQAPPGFTQSPIVLCFDYQVEALQRIVGGMTEVRAIETKIPS